MKQVLSLMFLMTVSFGIVVVGQEWRIEQLRARVTGLEQYVAERHYDLHPVMPAFINMAGGTNMFVTNCVVVRWYQGGAQ